MVQVWPQRDSLARQQYATDPTSRHNVFPDGRYSDPLNRHHIISQDRTAFDPADHGRGLDVHDSPRRQPPMQIDEALRSHCGIAAKRYFVTAISEDGNTMTFISPGQKLHDNVVRQFFDARRFQQVMERIEMGADPSMEDAFRFDDASARLGIYQPMSANRSLRTNEPEPHVRTARKRRGTRYLLHEDEDTPMVVSSRRAIKIADAQSVWNFYDQRLKNCQQNACKIMAKAWVKAVEPKKQTNHPYTGSDQRAPGWWPKPWGPTKEEKVRHKEPDHLYKPERVHLLAHILRLVVEPHAKQHSDIQRMNLNVKKLEEITFDALSAFFAEKDSNLKKKPYLNEIFKVARQEERYKNGEIDGTTEVYVMADDKIPEAFDSDNEEDSFVKEEDAQNTPRLRSDTLSATPSSERSPTANLPGSSFMGDLPMRPQFTHPIMQELPQQTHQFVEGTGMEVDSQTSVNPANGNLPLEMVQSPHDTSRRPSIYNSYTSPGATNMYPQQWQPSSSTANPSPMYGYTTTQASTAHPPFVNHAVPLGQGQAFMATNFEGTPRSNYDGTSSGLFRPNDLGHASDSHSEGYNYLPADSHPGSRGHMH